MKALIYKGNNTLVMEKVLDPTLQEGETLVKVHSVGICGSDLHAFHARDERRPPPLILGHEISGFIDRDGKTLPVVVNPLVTCGTCQACRLGKDNLCESRQIISMMPRQGAFAELLAVPDENIHVLPDDIDLTKAALVEPIACGWHGVRLAETYSYLPLEQARLAIIGAGAVGLGAAISARVLGVNQILIVETQEARRKIAMRQGFKVVEPSQAESKASQIDILIDAVGISPTRELASKLLIPGGVAIHVGLGDAQGGLDIRRFTLQEIIFSGSYTYTKKHFFEVVEALSENRLGSLDWYKPAPLEEGQQWFTALSANQVPATKVILQTDLGSSV